MSGGGWRRAACGLLALALLAGCSATPEEKPPTNPVAITVWHYYSGAQQQIFERLVDEFNASAGAEQNIAVEAHAYGSVGDLADKVMESIHREVGAEEIPDVFAAYADTAYAIHQEGMAADISQYLTPEEEARYVSAYLDEGRLNGQDGVQIFPIAKSTELLSVNATEWARFSAGTGASLGGLATWEGIARISEQYYQWTDSLTPGAPEDGKPFFGRDAFANYIIIGSYQLGRELFHVEGGKLALRLDEGVMRRLWDNYYVPYVNGYYAAYGKFRSDDLRTGDIAAFVGATSGAPFFPTDVTSEDGSTTPIEGAVYPLPNFEGTEPMAVQQGAGMVVAKSTPEKECAAVAFLKWFTEPAQNVRFATASGYLPVTYEANTEALILENGGGISDALRESLKIGVNMAQSYTFYTSRPFENGDSARQVVEHAMPDKAKEDRKAVEALIAGGVGRAEAVARFDTEENFHAWFRSFQEALTAAAGGA